jgi:hypothetical protein
MLFIEAHAACGCGEVEVVATLILVIAVGIVALAETLRDPRAIRVVAPVPMRHLERPPRRRA